MSEQIVKCILYHPANNIYSTFTCNSYLQAHIAFTYVQINTFYTILLTNLEFLQLRLNSYGHIIGTEYLSDLVEKEHTVQKHGKCLSAPIYFLV